MDIVKKKIGLCIELKDAFTHQSIEEDINVQVNGQLPVIKKERRYYIFKDMQADTIEVNITSKNYEDRTCTMQLMGYNKDVSLFIQGESIYNFFGIPLISIVLYPNENYILPAGYEKVKYEGNPMEEVRVIKDKKNIFLLASDYCGGETIQIMVPERQNIEGVGLRIMNQNEENYEDFSLLECKGGIQYVMGKSLEREYKKGSKIYELYCTRTNEKGLAAVIVKK